MGDVWVPVKMEWPVFALWVITLDFFTDNSSLCVLKKVLVMSISLSRAFSDLPRSTMSSAKQITLMLVESSSIPSPEEFRSCPRLLMNKLNNRGEKLQPGIL